MSNVDIIIHRGTHQIGGVATEIRTENARIIIDMGDELCLKPEDVSRPLDIDGVTNDNGKCDAVFFTHYHSDHIGQFHRVREGIPMYMGSLAKEIFLLSHHFESDEHKARAAKIKTFKARKGVKVKDITVIPFLVDHSASDAYMFLIKAGEKKILHTGDFRLHGFRSKGFLPTIQKYVGKVDAIITEGTNLGHTEGYNEDEFEIQRKLKDYMEEYRYVFLLCSSTNLERICSAMHAVPPNKFFAFDNYQDHLLDLISKTWGEKTELYRELLKDRGIELLSKKTDYEYDAIFFAQAIASATEKLYLTWFRDLGVSDASAGCSVFVDYVKQYFDNVDYVAIRHTDISSSREKDIAERSPECDRKDYTFKGVDLDETTSQELWKKVVSKKFSASSLGNYKKCPLRYLAAKVWKADKKDVLDDTPNVASLGILVHDVLETFIKDNVIPSGKTIQSSDYAELWKSLQDVFNKKAEEFEEKGYFGGPLWTIAKIEKLALLERWLKYEYGFVGDVAAFKPCATEWKFGYKKENPGYLITLKQIYEEESKNELEASFCGKVDRFDKNDKGEISIIDYKTGNAPGKDDIQVPLYILAVDELYKDSLGKDLSIQSGSYLELKGLPAKKSEIKIPFGFTKNGGYSYAKDAKKLEYEECLEYFRKTITELLDGIHKGEFLIDTKKLTNDNCKYCPLEKYCTAKSVEEENE